jgi:hypothetical protein
LPACYDGELVVNLTHQFYPDARHELFNETNRDEVTGNLVGWLGQVVARSTFPRQVMRQIVPATFVECVNTHSMPGFS